MKESKVKFIFVILTVVSALLATGLVYLYIESRVASEKRALEKQIGQHDYGQPTERKNIVVCARDIAEGETIGEEDVRVIEVERSASDQVNVISDPTLVIGRVAGQPLYAGEWLIYPKFVKGQPENCEVVVSEGLRALRIWVDATHGLLGLLEPKDHVDIIAVMDDKNKASRTILQNILVLAVGSRCQPRQKVNGTGGKDGNIGFLADKGVKETSITLELTGEQAAKLALAVNVGTIHLSLRNDADRQNLKSRTFRVGSLLDSRKKTTVRSVVRKQGPEVTFINGKYIHYGDKKQ